MGGLIGQWGHMEGLMGQWGHIKRLMGQWGHMGGSGGHTEGLMGQGQLWAPPDPHRAPQTARSGAAHEDHRAARAHCGGLQEEVIPMGPIKGCGAHGCVSSLPHKWGALPHKWGGTAPWGGLLPYRGESVCVNGVFLPIGGGQCPISGGYCPIAMALPHSNVTAP